MSQPADADRATEGSSVTEIRAILDDFPELVDTLPPAERAVAEALLEE